MYLQGNQIVFFTCLILVCITPLVSSRPKNESDRTDVADTSKTNNSPLRITDKFLEPTSKANLPRVASSINDDNEKYDRSSEIHRKKSRNRTKFVNNSKKSQFKRSENTNIGQKRPSNLKYIESEKKYFDYFPIEDVQLKYDPNEDNIRFILLSPEDLDKKKSKSKKFGRHSKKRESGRSKRDVSGKVTSALDDVSITSTRRNKRNLPYQYYNPSVVHSQSWVGGVLIPNNVYSNVQQPSATYLPVQKPQPVAGIYHNAFSPAANFLPRPINPDIASRFDDDRYVWGVSYQPSSSSNRIEDRPGKLTTKRPKSESTTPLPLIHGPKDNYHEDDYDDEDLPPKPAGGRGNGNQFGGGSNSIQQPPSIPPPRRIPEPSKCVWAIVNCCKRNSLIIRQSCFEQVGCVGAFWDTNPCADTLQDKALDHAQSFYEE